MPKNAPSYRLHKASGQAVVTIDGRDHYLGRHDSPASHEAYGRTIAAWKAGTLTTTMRSAAPVLTITAMVVAYLEHVETQQLYRKNGRKTSETYNLAIAMRPLVALYGGKAAADFGPLDLMTVRKALCSPLPPPKEGEPRRRVHGPIVRNSVNANVDRIRRVFRWATAMQLVPATTWQSLAAVESLRAGQSLGARESDPVLPADARSVAIVLRRVRPDVAACIRLQWLTGMRPGEVLRMRMADIDRKGKAWIYRPRSHKSEHRGKTRSVALGPKAQRVMAPFLRADPGAYLFRNRLGTDRIDDSVYRTVIREACREAGITPWRPNQLRHSAATRARSRADLDTASVLLGHSSPNTTLIYAEKDMRKAAEFALAHG